MNKVLKSAFGLAVGCALFAATTAAVGAQEVQKLDSKPVAKGECVGPLSLPVPSAKLVAPAWVFPGGLVAKTAPVALPASLPAGSYAASGGSEDVTHPATEDQLYEQWLAVFTNDGGTEVGRTSATPDLGANAVTDAWNLGTLVLTGTATKVSYWHAPVPNNLTGESVRPYCLNLTLIPLTGSCAGQVSLPVSGDKLVRTGQGLPNMSAVIALPAPLPAGQYAASAGSRDALHVPGVEVQNGEQWYAVFYAADSSVAGQTSATPDLADTKVVDFWAIGSVTLTKPAVWVRYFHANAAVSPLTGDSIEPLCLALTGDQYPPKKDDGDDDKPGTSGPGTSTPKNDDEDKPGSSQPGNSQPGNSQPKGGDDDESNTTVKRGNSDNPPSFPVVTVKQEEKKEDKRDDAVVVAVSSGTTTTVPAVKFSNAEVSVAPAAVAVIPVQPATEVLGTQVERPIAFTGSNSTPMVLAGAAFTVLGAGLLVVTRRRKGAAHLRK